MAVKGGGIALAVDENYIGERDDMIRSLWSEGADASVLSKIFCIGKAEVNRILFRESDKTESKIDRRLERVALATEMRKAGKTRREIAAELGVHVKTVNGYLKGEEPHRFLKPELWLEGIEPTETEKAKLKLLHDAYTEGDSQSALARKTGMSACVVNKLFKKFNLNSVFGVDEGAVSAKLSESSRKAQEKRKVQAAENRAKVYKLIDSGKDLEHVKKKTGLADGTIRKYLSERKASVEKDDMKG